MSDLSTRATVELLVNGQQAQQTLQQLRRNALDLETAIAHAAATGNKYDLKRLRKELADTKRQIREIESATQQVEYVLKNMDRATPRELQKTLTALTRQLEYVQRGSAAWDEHMEKIRRVKAEIAAVNAQMRTTENFWTRFNRTLNDWQMSIMGAIAALSGFVYAGRSAVKAFADMDEQLANTRKYTGMTEEKVSELNDAFRSMNTRTAREELNELAQEAGRLGKNTIESVKGYVEAADIIKVALVDLGDGATQTIAKLTTIFGVEKQLGTRDAMLAVGSAVNVLSQNCTASKPYLVEFAQRMAGVGSQAHMAIPEILAFGAVLDANGQKVEMSASALGKMIMFMFQDPAAIARQVGLDVEKFTNTLQRSTTEGVVMFLKRIQQLGSKEGLAVLSPLFKDLGMDGVRMTQVLGSLATHVGEVTWQLGNAKKAFREASSATREFEIFNNTTQASLDKAKNRMHELAVSLGEKLLPVMMHVLRQTTLTLKVLNSMVTFFIEYRREIISTTAVIAAYTIGINANAIAVKVATAASIAWNAVVGLGRNIVAGYTGAMVLCNEALAGCSLAHGRLHALMLTQNSVTKVLAASTALLKVAYYTLSLQFTAAGRSLKSFYAIMSANPYGIVLAALAAVAVAIYNNNQKKKEARRLQEEERKARKEMMKEYDDEAARIKFLSSVLNDNTRELADRKKALLSLQKIAPDYHAELTTEGQLINNNTEALDAYLKKLKESVVMKANREKLEALYKQQSDLQEERDTQSDAYWKIRQQNTLQGYDRNSPVAKVNDAWNRLVGNENTEAGAKEKLDETERKLAEVEKKIAELEKVVTPEEAAEPGPGSHEVSEVAYNPPAEEEQKKGKEDKFAAEKEWKEREEALNRISYAMGVKNFEAYTTRMDEIAREFHRKQLEHTDLTDTERLSLEAKFHEAVRKIELDEEKGKISEEKLRYDEEMTIIKQRYMDGESTTEQFNAASELAELAHLRRMVRITDEGSEERLKAEKAYNDRLLADQKKRQKEAEEAEKKHQELLRKMKEQAFGDNPRERYAKYTDELDILREVYDMEIVAAADNAKERLRIEKDFQKAKLALMDKYNIEGADMNRNFLESWNKDVVDFLESETGQAITKSFDVVVSGMSSIFQQLTTIVQAELQIQTAAIERRYKRETSLAEGNNYIIKRLEKQKEDETVKAKKEANRKMFAMQVIQAVAQTATGAINAYSSAAAIPMIGWIMAPVAAGLAVAAGAIQIAAIKKQQQASEATGYAKGGFTKKGNKLEEAGIVHAGEWVASQELVNSPVARPLIDALDYAQRTNTIGSLRADDVSSSITAPVVLAQNSNAMRSTPQKVVENVPGTEGGSVAGGMAEYAETMRQLKERLDEPFVTVNTVTGDYGMMQAQDEYDRLMMNKTPKSRR